MTEEYNLFALFYVKVDVVEQHRSVNITSLQVVYFKNLVAWFTFHLEDNSWIFAAGRFDFVHIQLSQHLFTAGCLFAFCHISRKSAYKFFEFLFPFFRFCFLVLCLTQSQLTTFIPE